MKWPVSRVHGVRLERWLALVMMVIPVNDGSPGVSNVETSAFKSVKANERIVGWEGYSEFASVGTLSN
jgi:hypothetical protein